MDYNKDAIGRAFHSFWKTNKGNIRYRLSAKDVTPTKVSSFDIQLTEGDYGDGFNFQCHALNLRVEIDNLEQPFNATFTIKVDVTIQQEGEKPIETVKAIKDNTIFLSK